MQAIDPTLVHRERYTGPEMVTPNAPAGTYSAGATAHASRDSVSLPAR